MTEKTTPESVLAAADTLRWEAGANLHDTLMESIYADAGRIADRTAERLGRGDVGVIMIRRLWARELQAMTNGKPLKNWTRTPDIAPEVWGLRGTPAIGPTNGGDTDDAPTATLVDVRPYIEINSLLELLGGRPG